MPLPNHKVIPDGWAAHHRPTAEGKHTATGTITRPASGATVTFDETAGRVVIPDPTTIYTGPMGVRRLDTNLIGIPMVAGDREQIVRLYRVAVPVTVTAVEGNDIVTVTECADDPAVVGRPLRVRDVRVGSVAWERLLMCEDITPTAR